MGSDGALHLMLPEHARSDASFGTPAWSSGRSSYCAKRLR